MNAKVESSKAQLAAASTGATAARYAGRAGDTEAWQAAMEEIQACLAEYRTSGPDGRGAVPGRGTVHHA